MHFPIRAHYCDSESASCNFIPLNTMRYVEQGIDPTISRIRGKHTTLKPSRRFCSKKMPYHFALLSENDDTRDNR